MITPTLMRRFGVTRLLVVGAVLASVFMAGSGFVTAAPALLLLARLLQGLSLGGEYGSSATYLSEMAGSRHRGFYASFQYVTLIGGQLLALLAQRHQPMSAPELMAATGLAKSTLYRQLSLLRRWGHALGTQARQGLQLLARRLHQTRLGIVTAGQLDAGRAGP
ncbi:hypothetical protein KXX11_004336, partial [Aspergillus fumigatus]